MYLTNSNIQATPLSSEKNRLNPTPRTLVLLASPELEKGQDMPQPPTTIAKFGRLRNQLDSVLPPGSSQSFGQKYDSASTVVDLTESAHDRKLLRKMPFTVKTFQYVMKRMSMHSWVARVIGRAHAPFFEKATTEMPLYPGSCSTGETERAIVYNCRTSNARPNDLAVAVTHFPTRRLTFAVVFGCSREQEKTVISRLEKAGGDVAHPMLLPGIVAELERKRQFDAVDDMTDELERRILELDFETVTTRNQHGTTQGERSRHKTKAWRDMSFLRTGLQGQKTLLTRMRKHVDEFPLVAKYQSETSYRDAETVRSELETKLLDLDGDCIKKAGTRMKDRLLELMDEYDEKIRDCLMRVEGMEMATQWSHGEKSLALATATSQDSSQMRSIALVTMVFLPGTFFASFFSMTFFNWNPGNSSETQESIASGNIWIYFALTIVSTFITFALFWNFVLRRQKRSSRRQNARRPSIPHLYPM
ncbi:hypothetical protein B0T18DRAFT_412099 [Schizothecium vesticola]|uniref:Cora-domain-containing protein n=1 Tax=Schizothecium vesticola TaxID=314040 RepID=A0AA40K5G1_9PEZI|nr:hypothetical protein B0T18DRAFT_412099 [Schizothecium vesticola]